MPLSPGNLIAKRYRILRLLGEGGFGAVYLAEDTRLGNKRVAVKESFQNSSDAQQQFRLEARLLANLDHPGLPRVTDNFIENNSRQFLVMDFIEGEDLHEQVVKTGRPMAEQEAVNLMLQICEAIGYLHDQKPQPIIHRDIKPPNIKITREGRAVVVDFGIAKVYHPQKGTARVAKAVSLHFSPPEQHIGKTDTRSDVYALGATLYCLVCAELPPDSMDRLTQGRPVVLPSRINARLGPALDQIIMHALELNSDLRFANAGEMARALRAYLTGQSVPPSKPGPQVATGPVCPNCGRVNRLGAKFCITDGTSLTTAPEPLAALPPGVRFEMANELARQSKYTHAIIEYQQCLKQGQKDPAVFHNLGVCYLLSQQPQSAAQILAHGAAFYPSDPELQFQLARAYIDLGQLPNALACAEGACQLNPQDPGNLRLYATLLIDIQRPLDAAHYLEAAARLAPDSKSTQLALGRAYFLADQLPKAIPVLQKAIQRQPDSAEGHFILGLCYHRQRQSTEAIRSLKEAVGYDPTNGLAHYFLAESCLQQDNYTDALVAYSQAADLLPNDPDARAGMAVCYARTNRPTEARRAAQAALGLDPNHTAARDLLTRLN